TPAIAAAAHRSVGLDRLVAELAGGSDPEVQAPVDDDSAAHAGPDGHEHGRAATAGGTELRLADRERPRIVDEQRGRSERAGDRSRDRCARPVAREVGEERGRAGVDVEDSRHAYADRVWRHAVQSAPADLRKTLYDPRRPLVRVRRGRAGG